MSPCGQVTALIKEHYWRPHLKILLCSQDIADGLGEEAPGGNFEPPEHAALTSLMAIQINITQDVPPGFWRLTSHDHCEVDTEKRIVRHTQCTIIGQSPA